MGEMSGTAHKALGTDPAPGETPDATRPEPAPGPRDDETPAAPRGETQDLTRAGARDGTPSETQGATPGLALRGIQDGPPALTPGDTPTPSETRDEPRRGTQTRPATAASSGRGRARAIRALGHPATTAIAAWLLLTPLAMAFPRLAHANPFTMRGAMMPVAAGGLLLAGFAAVFAVLGASRVRDNAPGRSPEPPPARPSVAESRRAEASRPSSAKVPGRRWRALTDALAGAAAGTFAAWVALTLRTALNGTPFGFAGLIGDTGRLTAMAERYSVTWTSADGIVAHVAAEYPPLYPWLIGRASALTGIPAWRLLGPAEVLTTSAAVMAAFLLWRRLVAAPVALAVAVAGLAAFGEPRKAYEVIALAVFVPWTLATFGAPPRGRLRWLPAGVLGGLLILTYHGFLMWASPGVVALAALTWRAAADRRGYLLHLLKVVIVATVVASWYLVPYAAALLLHGGQMVADLYQSPSILTNPFPFLAATPLGALELAGLAGTLWYRRVAWWATPLLCLVLGTYLYRALMLVRFVADGHTGQLYYTTRLVSGLLAAAGVLTLVQAVPALVRRAATRAVPPPGLGVAVLAVLLAWTGFTYWNTWMPGRGGSTSGISAAPRPWPANYTVYAHVEPLPDGRLPRYAPERPVTRWFPVDPIRRAVARVLGPHAAPQTLSYDERLFAYLPWPGYIAVDRTAAYTPTRWDDRHAALVRLAAITDPAAFARASAHTAFGRIDLFVLRRSGTEWVWRDVRFRPRQFAPASFAIVADLPEDTVLAIRRPAAGAGTAGFPILKEPT